MENIIALADITVRSDIKSANYLNGKHFGAGVAKKKELRTSAQVQGLAAKYRQKPGDGRIMAICIRYAARAFDTDNQARGMKPILDGLNKAGVLIEDNPKWLVSVYMHQPALKKATESQRVILMRIDHALVVFAALVRGHYLGPDVSVGDFLLQVEQQAQPKV